MKFTQHDIKAMEQRYRAHFVNSLSGFKSANLVGTRSASGLDNLCIVSSVIHLGADPAIMAFINRPHTVERHTLENIMETGVYTLNQVNLGIYKNAHHTAARYDRDQSEFDMAGLTPVDDGYAAPYVQESRVRMGMRLVEKLDLQVNGTHMVIGEIQEVFVESPEWLSEDGKLSVEAAETVSISGLDEYHTSTSLERLPYAKPNK